MKRVVLVWLILFMSLLPAHADQQKAISDWFAALKTADRDVFGSLLTEDAKVIIKSLQTVQTKQEYIEALDTWEEVVGDLRLSYSTDRVDAERIVAIVCYNFAANSFTNRETFSFDDGKVFSVLQEKIQDGC